MLRQTTLFIVTITWSTVSCGRHSTPEGADVTPPPEADTAADASTQDALVTKPETHGPASIVNMFAIGDKASAFDLDGDGSSDNRLGDAREAVNHLFESSLMSGKFRLVIDLRMLDDPLFRNDSELFVDGYDAVDLDSPKNPDDDFSGSEAFWCKTDDLSSDKCEPVTHLTASLDEGQIVGVADPLALSFGGLGTLPLLRAQFQAHIIPLGNGFSITQSRLGGIVTACSLNEMEPLIDSNPLWLVAHTFGLQPDMDLDGDGLEVIQTDPFGVESCLDPRDLDNPAPVIIEGENCGCAEGIADGYSVLMIMTGVSAELLGPAPSQR